MPTDALLLLLSLSFVHSNLLTPQVELQCHMCNASYFCSRGERYECPEHSLAAVAFADSISECVCNAGYVRENDKCNLGQPPAWFLYGNASFCVHTRETIVMGASSHADCVCVPGFAGLPIDKPQNCLPCPSNSFANQYNSSECVHCPEHSSHNKTQQSSVKACLCNAGFSGPDGGPCVACAAGKYKSSVGDASCQNCSVNTYSLAAAAQCMVCHEQSSSVVGSPSVDFCKCNAGFEPSSTGCSKCQKGSYKDTLANDACKHCIDNTFASEEGATACTQCNVTSAFSSAKPSEAGEVCECNAGYTQAEEGQITPACHACPLDTYQTSKGQTACDKCDPHARSPYGSVTSDACLCNAGFFDNGLHKCASCAAGTYKLAAETIQTDLEACTPCPVSSNSLRESARIQDCLCLPGFSGPDGGPCLPCAAGKFKAKNGTDNCQDCPLHTYNDKEGATECASCTVLLFSVAGITAFAGQRSPENCTCDVSQGYEELVLTTSRTCSACKPGTFATASGCQDCLHGTYSDKSQSTVCQLCAENTSSYTYPHAACQCNKGFKCNSEHAMIEFGGNITECSCDACGSGTFKNYSGTALACDICQPHSTSAPASVSQTMCLCERGYVHDDSGKHLCVLCAAGKYSDNLGTRSCSQCPAYTYTPSAMLPWHTGLACVQCVICNLETSNVYTNHYDAARGGLGCGQDEPSICTECPFNSVLLRATTASDRNAGVQSCVCAEDYYGAVGSACTACPLHQVRPGLLHANTTLADCLCGAGFEPDNAAQFFCKQCAIGSYKSDAGDKTCTECPPTLTTEAAGASEASACVCKPGYGYIDGVCQQCPANFYKSGFNLQQCQACHAHSVATAGAASAHDCTCGAGAMPAHGAAGCQLCFAGSFKDNIRDEPCKQCLPDTATNSTGSAICESCTAGKTTDGLSGQLECVCNAGTELLSVGFQCETCRTGRYKATHTQKYANRECVTCGACEAEQQVATECNSTNDITCKPCQEHSWVAAGRIVLQPCLCDAGYELQQDKCVACVPGTARKTNANNSIACQVCTHGFANTSAQSSCFPCTALCEESISFVRHECNAVRDVVCQRCQLCSVGFYANNTCGQNYGYGRLDTQCALCTSNFFCPGGDLSQTRHHCPANSQSVAGSESVAKCLCDAGFYRLNDECSICPLDHYCPRGVLAPIACPATARTLYLGSAVRLDCHCARGYFRDPPSAEDSFDCSICTENDYCFDNLLYNCSDPLMSSDLGSGFADNCTCVNRYYNNGTRCEDCVQDNFCVEGRQHPCAELEWTNGLTRQETCVCKPGFARAGKHCVPCMDNFFCDGSDDLQHSCPAAALSQGASFESQCLCDVNYEPVFGSNISDPHACHMCASNQFKDNVSNTPCRQCSECLPATHSVWTMIVCADGFDAQCTPCTICHDKNASVQRWESSACSQYVDTQCKVCTLCNDTIEWEKRICSEKHDRECALIQRERSCSVGQYAGKHTKTSDSICLPCDINDTLYEGQHLHFYTSAGRRYDDASSCDISCHEFSRLRDVHNPALGCISCETGNVFFKVFTQNDLVCSFTCMPGYIRVEDDCVLAALQANEYSYWNHSLQVTHVRRVAVHGAAAFRITLSHTAHGFFAIVVGKEEPSCDAFKSLMLHSPAQRICCFARHWRVSTKNQLGLGNNGRETCSLPNPPPSQRLSNSQLEFDVEDSRLDELANCTNTHSGAFACALRVSIVDTILMHHESVIIKLELQRGAALAFLPGPHTYIPLLSFSAEVQLAYLDAGHPVFLVTSNMAQLPTAGLTQVLLSAGLDVVQPAADVNCGRYVRGVSMSTWVLNAKNQRFHTFFRAAVGTTVVRLLYALRLLQRQGANENDAGNVMNIAVWRNVSLSHAVCETAPTTLTVRTGEVLSCSGLGEAAVQEAAVLRNVLQTVHGELGGLTSFVARALHAHVHDIVAASMLVAFALPSATHLLQADVVAAHSGLLAFTDTFRSACSGNQDCHFQHVHGNGVLFLNSCAAKEQQAARAWLAYAQGVADDAGHVHALCSLAQQQQHHKTYSFLIVLVNTRAYMPRSIQWHALQNHTAAQSISKVFVAFQFK